FNRIRNKLPREIEKPVIAKYEYLDVPMMILAITSDIRTPEELRKIVEEKVKNHIQRIEGVARAEVSGGREGKVLIEIDQHKLRAHSLSINQIVDTINLNNANLLSGEIKRARDKYLVRTIGEFQSLSEIENLAVVTTRQGSVIRVKDIGEVKDSYLDPVAFARVNTQPVVSIYIQKESTANTIKISRLIDREIRALKEILAEDIKITPTFNQASYIQNAVNQVKTSLGYGAILAIFILLFFLRDLRSVFIITLTIPISILLSFSLMFFGKITLNVMTLSGLALGIGMLLDNSIVVLENIFKKRQNLVSQSASLPVGQPGDQSAGQPDDQSAGQPGDQSAGQPGDQPVVQPLSPSEEKNTAVTGANEMLLAIVASTITTLAVFLPLVFINPEIKMLYSGIALTITFSLLASLLVSLALVPMLTAKMRLGHRETPNAPRQSAFSRSLRFLTFKGFTNKFIGFYQRLAGYCLNFRYLIIAIMILAFVFTFQQSQKLEKEFIGVAEQNKFTVFIQLPTGTRLEISDKIVSQVEKIVSARPEVKTVTAKVEPWSSKVYVELLPLNKRKISTGEVIKLLRPLTDKIETAFIYYEEPEEVGTKEILLEIYGHDYEILKGLAMQIAQKIQPIPKFTDVKIRMREGRPEMRLNIHKRQAALFGLSTEDIALSLHTQMRGLVATRYRGGNEPLLRLKEETLLGQQPHYFSSEREKTLQRKSAEFKNLTTPGSDLREKQKPSKEVETIARLEEQYRRTFKDLRRISILTPDERQIYLSQLAEFKFDLGPSEVWRKNKARMVQVSANTGGMALGTAADNVKTALSDLKLPKDYFWQFGGNYARMIQNQNELRFALILSLVLVYMILAGLFESFKQPFIILFSVPLAAAGAIAALRITNKPVGTGVLIGAIMLGGIVVNNAIILIDRINFLIRSQGATSKAKMRQAVTTASRDRLRPILMTSLTTILGLLPMALDKSESSNLWSPLAITVIGGLSVSTILTLFVIPSVYLIFEDLRK
ncbi:MAG: efflux RND transporter permease subunit, partial [Candidatus Omnitrophota bacterium]|nr:efflux RND transporter permease subunit [Candidatus Omnitrophota bacterium]